MVREFVEISSFTKRLREVEDASILGEIQNEILKNPAVGAVIKGTGGIRKMRCGAEGRGKRGGHRVLCVDFPTVEKVYLLVIYAKNEQEDLSVNEKKILSQLVERLRKELGA